MRLIANWVVMVCLCPHLGNTGIWESVVAETYIFYLKKVAKYKEYSLTDPAFIILFKSRGRLLQLPSMVSVAIQYDPLA